MPANVGALSQIRSAVRWLCTSYRPEACCTGDAYGSPPRRLTARQHTTREAPMNRFKLGTAVARAGDRLHRAVRRARRRRLRRRHRLDRRPRDQEQLRRQQGHQEQLDRSAEDVKTSSLTGSDLADNVAQGLRHRRELGLGQGAGAPVQADNAADHRTRQRQQRRLGRWAGSTFRKVGLPPHTAARSDRQRGRVAAQRGGPPAASR